MLVYKVTRRDRLTGLFDIYWGSLQMAEDHFARELEFGSAQSVSLSEVDVRESASLLELLNRTYFTNSETCLRHWDEVTA